MRAAEADRLLEEQRRMDELLKQYRSQEQNIVTGSQEMPTANQGQQQVDMYKEW